jgi:hypothetical protein
VVGNARAKCGITQRSSGSTLGNRARLRGRLLEVQFVRLVGERVAGFTHLRHRMGRNVQALLCSLIIALLAIIFDGSQRHVVAEESRQYIDPLDHRPRSCVAEVSDGTHMIDVPIMKENDMRSWLASIEHSQPAGFSDWVMGSWAYSAWDNRDGHPFIWLNYTVLSEFPPIVTRFTFYHECAHLTEQTEDEIKGNCAGLKRMRAAGDLSLKEEATIRENHYNMGDLDSRYLGSGKNYWDATIRCAGARLPEDKWLSQH